MFPLNFTSAIIIVTSKSASERWRLSAKIGWNILLSRNYGKVRQLLFPLTKARFENWPQYSATDFNLMSIFLRKSSLGCVPIIGKNRPVALIIVHGRENHFQHQVMMMLYNWKNSANAPYQCLLDNFQLKSSMKDGFGMQIQLEHLINKSSWRVHLSN